MTFNSTWGYSDHDKAWKSNEVLPSAAPDKIATVVTLDIEGTPKIVE